MTKTKYLEFNQSKTFTVNFGKNKRFSLTNLHDDRLWSATEGFFDGLMSCADVFAIPECEWWGLVGGSKILENGSLEIDITLGFGDSKDPECLIEHRECCILPQFVSCLQ